MFGLTNCHSQCCNLAVTKTLRKDKACIVTSERPELAPVIIDLCDAIGEHVFQRFGHALRSSAINPKGLFDIGQRNARRTRYCHFGAAKRSAAF